VTVTAIDHVLVLSDDIDTTRDFYVEVVGLHVGERPPLEFPGYWLYAESPSACLHLADRSAYLSHLPTLGLDAGQRASGDVDHIAFHANDYSSMAARIGSCGVSVVSNTVPGGPRQLFVEDPNGVRIEINVMAVAR
jgi:catechol 2,3-dioxygenase-like lactoylglutathione lyase family enzyme